MWIPFEVIAVYKYMRNVTILRGATKRLYQSHITTHFHSILIYVPFQLEAGWIPDLGWTFY